LINDDRIKGYVAEILADEKLLPAPPAGAAQSAPPAQTG
jgi:hypothetical protein